MKQKDGESNENYYKRLLARHTYESNDEYEVRIAFLEPFTPDLPIWKNYEYLNFITLEETTTERPPYEPRYLVSINCTVAVTTNPVCCINIRLILRSEVFLKQVRHNIILDLY